MDRVKELVESAAKVSEKKSEKVLVCSMCGKPATESVDGEPSCAAHVEQIYEHQVEDYTRQHLADNEWRKV
jgi:protein-arginine kinase activator protein McsA